jgi:hypothetical protein
MAGGTSALAAVAGTTTSSAAAAGCVVTRGEAMRRRLKRRAARLRLVAGVVSFAVATCAAATEAHAGTYSVWAHCYDNHSFVPASGSAGNLNAFTSCDARGFPAGMKMRALAHSDDSHFSREGDRASFRFKAPSGTRISGLRWKGTVYEGPTSFCLMLCSIQGDWRYHSGILGDNPAREFGLHCSNDNLGACAGVRESSAFPKDVEGNASGLSDGAVTFYVECSGDRCPSDSDGDAGHNFSRAWLTIGEARVDVTDNVDPVFDNARGDGWTAHGAWLNDKRQIAFDVSDNTGIDQAGFVVDPTPDRPWPLTAEFFPCDYTYAVPCGNHSAAGDGVSFDKTLNTAEYADGRHTLRIAARDAAGNWAWRDHVLNVDNHAPSEPLDASVDGGEDWHTTDGFEIDWTNPSQGDAAPITKANYELCPVDGSDCETGTQTGTDISKLTDLQVGEPGEYVARVWLVDAAGNTTPTAKSRELHLKFDDVPPEQATPQHRNGWVNREEASSYLQYIDAPNRSKVPLSGISGYAVTTDGSDPGTTPDVPADPGDFSAATDIGDLAEGVTLFKARAISGAGIPSPEYGTEAIHVDLTAPDLEVNGAPDPNRWSRSPVSLLVHATEPPGRSGMAGAEQADDADTHGAYVRYSVDSDSTRLVRGPAQAVDPSSGLRGFEAEATAAMSVSDDGPHVVRYSATDVAGNEAPERTVSFKIDRTAPAPVVFEPQRRADPRQITVTAADATSGLADGGVIRLRRIAPTRGEWIALRTTRAGSQYSARVENTRLPAGTYELVAAVPDQAGNVGVGTRNRGGGREVLHIDPSHVGPYPTDGDKPRPGPGEREGKTRTMVTAKLAAPVTKCRKVRRRKRCSTHVKLVRAARLPFGTKARASGRLTAGSKPLARAEITVLGRLRKDGAVYRAVGVVRTNGQGQFAYRVPAGASRTLAFLYRGTTKYHHSSAAVQVTVPAAATIKASRKRVRNGRSVVFSGRLRGLPYPTRGKVLDLQAFYRGKWRTFATPRSQVAGRWRYRYRFEATQGTVVYRFRIRVRASSDYPYALGYSRTVKVRVTG